MIAIVTGAYGAIGKAIADGIAARGFDVILVGRSAELLFRTAEELICRHPLVRITTAAFDLADEKEIRDFASGVPGPLHLLVNNAATAPPKKLHSSDGTEMQWAVNVLGYYRMIHYLHPLMSDPGFARIVNVASYWAGGLDLGDPEFRRRSYDNDSAYRQSKQANRMITAGYAGLLKEAGIRVNACHPGDVNSKLSNDLGFGGHETPAQGAGTPVWLATSGEVNDTTGSYFEHRTIVDCPFMRDTGGVKRLMELCAASLSV